MNALFDTAMYPAVLLCLGLVVSSMAAQLSLAWVERSSADESAARWRGLAAAGLAMGTGLWTAQAIGFSADAVHFDLFRDGGVQFAILGAAALVSTAALAGAGTRRASASRGLAAAAGLGAAAVAVQGLGLLAIGAASNTSAGHWHAGALALGAGCAVAGCPLAFLLWQRLRRVSRRAGAWGRLAAGRASAPRWW